MTPVLVNSKSDRGARLRPLSMRQPERLHAEGVREFSPGWSVAEPWVEAKTHDIALKERKNLFNAKARNTRSPFDSGGEGLRLGVDLLRSFRAVLHIDSNTQGSAALRRAFGA